MVAFDAQPLTAAVAPTAGRVQAAGERPAALSLFHRLRHPTTNATDASLCTDRHQSRGVV